MSIQKLVRGTIEEKLGAWRAELARLQEAQARIPELQAMIAEAEKLLADADSGKPAQITVAAREKPVAMEPPASKLPSGKTP